MVGLCAASACVDLTPPPEVVNYRNGLGKGGDHAGGGAVGSGGEVAGAGGGGAGGNGPAGFGGESGTSGSLPAGGGGVDAPQGNGGASGGGSSGRDAATTTGGHGGSPTDASSAGTEGSDAPLGGGGVPGSGGAQSMGGTISSGGIAGSGGVRGTGGVLGSGGATATGGAAVYHCASAVGPTNGVITDFADWDAVTGRWGTGALTGNVYPYGGTGTTMNAKVEGNPTGLHITGSIPSGGYGGGGLTFLSCLTVASFTKVSFDVYGSAAGCAIELQLQTYDQRPVDQTPAGACKNDGGSDCYKFPAKSQVVNLTNAVSAPGTTVSVTLSSFANWSTAAAGQMVGMQWQFTSSGGACTPNATFTNIKFLP